MIKLSSKTWWMTDDYAEENPIPPGMEEHAGPHGIALVKTNQAGATTPGWGLKERTDEQTGKVIPGFMVNYASGKFAPKKYLAAHQSLGTPFAFIMRSLNIVAIDIDGKNGGVENAESFLLGAPQTLAETSKSGTGVHLFYSTSLPWDVTIGFGQYADHNGVTQGVDVRGAGCIYHHNTQRWNNRPIAPLPDHLAQTLIRKVQSREAYRVEQGLLDQMDDIDKLLLQESLLAELKKPIPPGKRNESLFGLGSKLFSSQIPNWAELLEEKALDVGLDPEEVARIIRNIQRYT